MSFQSNTILVALELSNSLWLVGTRLPGAPRSRMHRISGKHPASAAVGLFFNAAVDFNEIAEAFNAER